MEIEKYILLKEKQRRGKLTKDEQQAWQQWSQSAEAAAWLQVDQVLDGYESNFEPDVEAGLARLKARMQAAKAQEIPLTKRGTFSVVSRRWLAVAAVLLLLIVAVLVLQNVVQPVSKTVVFSTQRAEGRNLTLTDGTKVKLNENSELSLPASFENEIKRAVELTGEAFFAVSPSEAQPFEIKAEEVVITVVGTAFNVRAYPQEATVEVEVVEGIVQMTVGNEQLTLRPREKGIYNGQKKTLKKYQAPQLNAQAWRTHQLKFSNTPLTELLQELSRYHRVRIELANDTLKKCVYTGNFSRTRLEDVLKSLEIGMNLQWDQPEKGHYIIRNGSCR